MSRRLQLIGVLSSSPGTGGDLALVGDEEGERLEEVGVGHRAQHAALVKLGAPGLPIAAQIEVGRATAAKVAVSSSKTVRDTPPVLTFSKTRQTAYLGVARWRRMTGSWYCRKRWMISDWNVAHCLTTSLSRGLRAGRAARPRPGVTAQGLVARVRRRVEHQPRALLGYECDASRWPAARRTAAKPKIGTLRL
jgi:hypothetical protein